MYNLVETGTALVGSRKKRGPVNYTKTRADLGFKSFKLFGSVLISQRREGAIKFPFVKNKKKVYFKFTLLNE
jgi:hypothetical protein